MNRFLQLHILTTYPPSNPNRDDLGRPKTARFGNSERMRISSQSLKRALRISDAFASSLKGKLGERTQRLGRILIEHLQSKGATSEQASQIARQVAEAFGKLKSEKDDNPADIEQLAFISPDERRFALELADKALSGEELPDKKELAKTILKRADGAADIAMFGRMLADNPDYNREAAVQVAHAITTNRVNIENDFYTAVDDLKTPAEDAGAGFIGELGFGSGVFYIYACINRHLLLENLDGDKGVASAAINALVEALATASPDGKKNSFAHGGRAEYVLAERGDQQPRTLVGAFLKHVADEDLMNSSIERLEKYRADMDTAYGACADDTAIMQLGGEGNLANITTFCTSDMGAA